MGLIDAVKELRPILYWVGRPGASGICRDLSGRGNNSSTSAGTIGRATAPLPGDPLMGWSADDTTAGFVRGSAITGFDTTQGTIIAWARIKDFAVVGGTRGIFDSAPSAVGAMRMFTTDDFATIRFDIGGDAAQSFTPNHPLGSDFHMFSLHWRSITPTVFAAIDGDVGAGAFYNGGTTPAGAGLGWGTVNGSSARGGSIFHSIAVFNRTLNSQDLKRLHQASRTSVRLSPQPAPAAPAGPALAATPSGLYYYG